MKEGKRMSSRRGGRSVTLAGTRFVTVGDVAIGIVERLRQAAERREGDRRSTAAALAARRVKTAREDP